jgi:hypothetical protein
MSPSDGIRKLGFRRWYERQLIESHAYFVTCFLCLIVVVASLEGFSFRGDSVKPLITLMTVFAAGAVGVGALKRYKSLLDRAEHIAEHCTCERCATYGRLLVLGANKDLTPAAQSNSPWMRVQCRKCGHQWLIE